MPASRTRFLALPLLLLPAIAWAGDGYTPFHSLACSLQGLSQGYLGIIISVLALLVGAGLYYLTKNMIFIPTSVGVAICLYFAPTVITDFFGISVQSCSLSQAVANNSYQNFINCNNDISREESLTGEYCSCKPNDFAKQQPECTSYAEACDASLSSYQTLSNQCSCSGAQENQDPDPVCQNLTTTADMTQADTLGNQFILQQSGEDDCVSLASGAGYVDASDYAGCVTYSNGTFSGYVNIGGTAQVGYVSGENSGFTGSGDQILADSLPPTSATCSGGLLAGQCFPESTQIATGGPLTYKNGTFSGTPITVNYLGDTGQTMQFTLTPNGGCITESLNGTNYGEYCP